MPLFDSIRNLAEGFGIDFSDGFAPDDLATMGDNIQSVISDHAPDLEQASEQLSQLGDTAAEFTQTASEGIAQAGDSLSEQIEGFDLSTVTEQLGADGELDLGDLARGFLGDGLGSLFGR